MTKLITTFFGVGLLPKAPGTWGTAAAIPVAWVLHGLLGFPGLLAATVLVFLIGWWAIKVETAGKDEQDPSEIVIDEVVGVWIALLPLSYGMWAHDQPQWLFPYPGWVTAFVFFRLFDIWKPGPVGWADRQHTPLGVILDDVIAGLMAAVVVMAFAGIYHGLIQ